MNISHDSVNRFLNRENLTPEDSFLETKSQLNATKEVLQGINLITLYYTDLNDNHLPVT